mmetsp:Transcript_61859/g.165723  ORF Transcript_61859/g.165723 Transcript_61859/m.165723 type:complete len:268 (-) Transcript_61859:1037-1840(-)
MDGTAHRFAKARTNSAAVAHPELPVFPKDGQYPNGHAGGIRGFRDFATKATTFHFHHLPPRLWRSPPRRPRVRAGISGTPPSSTHRPSLHCSRTTNRDSLPHAASLPRFPRESWKPPLQNAIFVAPCPAASLQVPCPFGSSRPWLAGQDWRLGGRAQQQPRSAATICVRGKLPPPPGQGAQARSVRLRAAMGHSGRPQELLSGSGHPSCAAVALNQACCTADATHPAPAPVETVHQPVSFASSRPCQACRGVSCSPRRPDWPGAEGP